ncbi:MAG: thioredoxin domain-containing protein [Candidatus Aminicenantes bacterium]|nr:thioredoxin domain-containing protein [Candidatus Aminicenantes bacterium]
MKHKYTNHLINESSPYLLQHAHNPVEWYPWGEAAFEKAKKENKPVIISIGYAACHWCHVMEQESFEDPQVAAVMNEHFVAIKVDREERPDIDQVYMNAAQLLTGRGGWPLHAIALPDGRPFYAGTYFPKENWLSVLRQISGIYKKDPQRLQKQAQAVSAGIRTAEVIRLEKEQAGFDRSTLHEIFARWEKLVDYRWGGLREAPKFPLPVGYRFLLKYFYMTGKEKALRAVRVTLDKMALGGIYDQVGGGFARYSTDKYWKVPHFEKMLYDNAQLVSLYAAAFQSTGDPLYKKVVYETLDFVAREMTTPSLPGGGSGFYSSLDADSEGEEGKYYTWTKEEIQQLTGKDAALIIEYYNVTARGNWEAGQNILFREKKDEAFAEEWAASAPGKSGVSDSSKPAVRAPYKPLRGQNSRNRGIQNPQYEKKEKLKIEDLQQRIAAAKRKLLTARSKRPAPPLDDKILTSWNALMLNAYVDAYRVFDDERFLQEALQNGEFLIKNMLSKDGRLNRVFKESRNAASINGFLDDYAFTIQAFISLYQATFDEKWLFEADRLMQYARAHFFTEESSMFYYTSALDPQLIARKMEVTDNVIPASNSVMALNLYLLGVYFYKEDYIGTARQMLNNVNAKLVQGGTYYSNWALLMTYFIEKPFEVAIVGEECIKKRKELDAYYLPHVILLGGREEGKLPLLKSKSIPGQTTIFVCKDRVCLLPTTETKKALEQISPAASFSLD